MKTCIICNEELKGNKIKYCSFKCKAKGHYQALKINTNTIYSQFKRADSRKKDLIKIFGNCCSRCGYNKNYSALHFHHIKEKSFQLDIRNIGNRSMESLLKELKKCILLCANCHAEEHYPDLLL